MPVKKPESFPRVPLPVAIAEGRVLPIVRGDFSVEAILAIGHALAQAGVRAMEVSLNSPFALASIAGLVERYQSSELMVGAGTVIDVTGAQEAVHAGAQFLVSPAIAPDVLTWATRRQIPIFPGAMTPTEVLLAWSAGATAVKLFPASWGGASHVRDLATPLGSIPMIAVGGVTAENATSYLNAGAAAVGIGGWLTGDGEPGGVYARATQLIASITSM